MMMKQKARNKQMYKSTCTCVRISFRVKMSYGKDDFLDWDDETLDLDLLLGDYTCSEVELSDDEVVNKKSKTVKARVVKDKIYQCDSCDNSYCTISGLRGHLQKKHGITSVKGRFRFLFCILRLL